MILPVSRKIKLKSNTEILWDLISSPENLNLVHPFCKSNKVIKWDNNSHSDSLLYYNNRTYIREFFEWEEGKGYKLYIGEEGKKKSKVIWEIIKNKNNSILKISVYPYIFNDKAVIPYLFYYVLFIKPGLSKYLDNVLKGIDWYLTNETPVKKNQFGTHKWFSI